MEIETVKMIRDHAPDGGPTEADVHPDEVANYQEGGWRVVDAPAQGEEAQDAPAPAKRGKK